MKRTILPLHLSIVRDILQKHLPVGGTVWVFGSRVKGTNKKFADLDLALDHNGCPMPSHIMAKLAYDFEMSDLPYKVDIVDWNTISDSFKAHIQSDRILLEWAPRIPSAVETKKHSGNQKQTSPKNETDP
jgi:predicted nucleotidyltransferase